MATLQEVCDAVETIVEALGGITLYSEAEERPEILVREGIAGELNVEDLQAVTNCGSTRGIFTIVLSTPSANLGWGGATRRVRPYIDPAGAFSIPAALRGSSGLGLSGVAVGNIVSGRERTVDYGPEKRRVGSVSFEVMF
mgnify:CR=1 FL=1